MSFRDKVIRLGKKVAERLGIGISMKEIIERESYMNEWLATVLEAKAILSLMNMGTGPIDELLENIKKYKVTPFERDPNEVLENIHRYENLQQRLSKIIAKHLEVKELRSRLNEGDEKALEDYERASHEFAKLLDIFFKEISNIQK